MADVAAWLVRRRVALGFASAAVALALAQPTWSTWRVGFAVAVAGEALRVWAAGHLEKSREVTSSGPYRFVRHPLYVGSTVIALGVVIAASSVPVAVLVALYIGLTIPAAIRSEEGFLRGRFGDAYDRRGATASARRFSLARARWNREHRALFGLFAGFLILAAKILIST